MKRIVIILLMLVLVGLGCRKRPEERVIELPPELRGGVPVAAEPALREELLATYFSVAPRERVKSGPLTIEIKEISALTADGCEVGPTGCPDSVEMTVSIPGSDQTFRLVVLGGSRSSASSERTVFGHRVVLSSVERDRATIGIFVAQNPTVAPSPSGSGPGAIPQGGGGSTSGY